MNTSEVLNLTADRIERDGWTKGKGWSAAPGEPTCVEGALMAVLGASGRTGSGIRSCPAYVAVQRYLDIETGLWIWNDFLAFKPDGGGWVGGSQEAAVAAAAETVVEVLRAAALIEAAKETDVRAVSPRVAVSA